jgi:hypothetical protein
MGDRNQMLFGMMHLGLFRSPCLEIGSKECGHTVSFRRVLDWGPGNYVGVDAEAGPGVDVIADLGVDFARVADLLPGPFATVFCLSVLEHSRQPFRMAENIQRLLAPAAILFVSVPFAWEIHRFPEDYWRFTPDGVRLLFPGIEFLPGHCAYHTQVENDFRPLEQGPPRLGRALNAAGRPPRGALYRAASAWLGRSRRLRRLLPYDYLHPPVMIDMIGRKGRGG